MYPAKQATAVRPRVWCSKPSGKTSAGAGQGGSAAAAGQRCSDAAAGRSAAAAARCSSCRAASDLDLDGMPRHGRARAPRIHPAGGGQCGGVQVAGGHRDRAAPLHLQHRQRPGAVGYWGEAAWGRVPALPRVVAAPAHH